MQPPQRKAVLRNGEKAKPADIISICSLHHICYQFILFASSVKMDMVPLIFFPLPAWHRVKLCQQRAGERHCRRPRVFASCFLCVGSAGSCNMHFCQHPALPGHTGLLQCPATSALTASSACTLASMFSGQLLPSVPRQAALQQSTSSETPLHESSGTLERAFHRSSQGKTSRKFCQCSSRVTAQLYSEAEPRLLQRGLSLSLGVGLLLGCSI